MPDWLKRHIGGAGRCDRHMRAPSARQRVSPCGFEAALQKNRAKVRFFVAPPENGPYRATPDVRRQPATTVCRRAAFLAKPAASRPDSCASDAHVSARPAIEIDAARHRAT